MPKSKSENRSLFRLKLTISRSSSPLPRTASSAMPRKKSETNRSYPPFAPKASAFGAFFVPSRSDLRVSFPRMQPMRRAYRAGIAAPGLLSSKSDGECALSPTYRPQLRKANPSTPHFPQKVGNFGSEGCRLCQSCPSVLVSMGF